ncbi:NifU family protein [Rhodospirillaceae bacterium SYSU D60014]|uniref:NifU family protein n=1 Tax=Virgifigura deserti TaxID=2268457 RepID=UPI000E661437
MAASDPAATRRDDLAGLLGDLERLETIFATWDEVPRSAVEAYRRAIDALHGEALRRLIRTLRTNPAALAAMKEAVADDVVYAVLRHHELIKPSLNERVEAALASVRPMLASHGGDVRLARVAPPAIEVQLTGACDGCAASALTFHAGIKKAVQEVCPEITDIVQVKGLAPDNGVRFVSPFALGQNGTWRPVCVLSEIPEGGIRAMEIGGQRVALFRRDTAVTCFQDACAHLGLAIHDGEVENGIITCPHHGFRYDLTSGECLTAPEVQLQPHAVRVIGDWVEVRLTT